MKLTMTLSEPLSDKSVMEVGLPVVIRALSQEQLFTVVSISDDRTTIELEKTARTKEEGK